MRCAKCGKDNVTEAVTCEGCGINLVKGWRLFGALTGAIGLALGASISDNDLGAMVVGGTIMGAVWNCVLGGMQGLFMGAVRGAVAFGLGAGAGMLVWLAPVEALEKAVSAPTLLGAQAALHLLAIGVVGAVGGAFLGGSVASGRGAVRGFVGFALGFVAMGGLVALVASLPGLSEPSAAQLAAGGIVGTLLVAGMALAGAIGGAFLGEVIAQRRPGKPCDKSN